MCNIENTFKLHFFIVHYLKYRKTTINNVNSHLLRMYWGWFCLRRLLKMRDKKQHVSCMTPTSPTFWNWTKFSTQIHERRVRNSEVIWFSQLDEEIPISPTFVILPDYEATWIITVCLTISWLLVFKQINYILWNSIL